MAVFLENEMNVATGVALVALVGMLLQLLAQPYRIKWVNSLQTVACTSLVTITIFHYGSGVLTAVGFDPTDTPFQSFMDDLDVAMLVLMFIPPVFFVWKTVCSMIQDTEPDTESEQVFKDNENEKEEERGIR